MKLFEIGGKPSNTWYLSSIPHKRNSVLRKFVSYLHHPSMDRVSQNNNDPSKGNLRRGLGDGSYDLHAGKLAPRRASDAP
jgi:hypothetical protein